VLSRSELVLVQLHSNLALEEIHHLGGVEEPSPASHSDPGCVV
jgi:hypothetical protein